MVIYSLGTSQSARANLDQKAANDGYEDACAHYPDAVLEGDALKQQADELVDLAFDQNEDLTDDLEEYRARYVDAYCQAYTKEIQSRNDE